MKMNFSKDELAMVYQYAAGTKEETLAGLKEIVPVIRDRQTREIVESTIRKLDAIPEPECRRFIADTKQRFIQKRDHSIRRRLAEAKAQARTEKPHHSGNFPRISSVHGTWKNESGRKGNRDAKIRIGRSPHYGGDYGHRSRGERTQCIGYDHRKRRTFRSGSATPAQRACRSWRRTIVLYLDDIL